MPDLCQLLESVCTARDFLLEVGGEEERSLSQFMVNINLDIIVFLNHYYQAKLRLYIGDDNNAKHSPLRHFTLGHVDSLIKFMGLVRAKVMIRNDQNPFEQVTCLSSEPSLLIVFSGHSCRV